MVAARQPPFVELFREHAPHAGRVLQNLGVSEADLPGVLEEVFLIIQRKLPGLRGDSSLLLGICGVCLRVAAEYRSRLRESDPGIDDAPPTARSSAPPDDPSERRWALSRLDAALGALDDDQRAVFVLYEIEELTLAELAIVTGAPMPEVYSRLVDARGAIQAAFGPEPARSAAR
jgi:RNA polymerase sigma-70 factor (ECF subfamily)